MKCWRQQAVFLSCRDIWVDRGDGQLTATPRVPVGHATRKKTMRCVVGSMGVNKRSSGGGVVQLRNVP